MQYWGEMDSKWGFSDGEAIPPHAEKYRSVYIQAMNVLLKRHDSNIRIVAFDRPGFHNWCLFFRVTKDHYGKLMAIDPQIATNGDVGKHLPGDYAEPEVDSAYQDALGEAHEMCLDDYVEVTVKVDRNGLEQALAQA